MNSTSETMQAAIRAIDLALSLTNRANRKLEEAARAEIKALRTHHWSQRLRHLADAGRQIRATRTDLTLARGHLLVADLMQRATDDHWTREE